MEVHYSLNREDVAAFVKYSGKPNSRLIAIVITLFCMIVAAAYAVRPMFRREGTHMFMDPWFWEATFASLAIYVLIEIAWNTLQNLMLVRGAAKRTYFASPHRLWITEAAVYDKGQNGVCVLPWSDIQRIVDAPEHMLFLLATWKGFIIPKRAFSDPHTAEQFLAQARELQRKAKAVEPIAPPVS